MTMTCPNGHANPERQTLCPCCGAVLVTPSQASPTSRGADRVTESWSRREALRFFSSQEAAPRRWS